MRILQVIFLSPLIAASSGCVVFQIRDELRSTNAQLATINRQLGTMSVDLAQVNASIRQASPAIQTSNHSLHVVESSMEPIRISLRRIDDELVGFREMIDKIDKYIPINIKPETPQPAKQTPTHETTPQK
jgi:septal ring factor EnvC (AmiA/AmiB activator)